MPLTRRCLSFVVSLVVDGVRSTQIIIDRLGGNDTGVTHQLVCLEREEVKEGGGHQGDRHDFFRSNWVKASVLHVTVRRRRSLFM